MAGEDLDKDLFKNWVRGAKGLEYLQEGLQDFVEEKVRLCRSQSLQRVTESLPTGKARQCNQCTSENLLPDHAEKKNACCMQRIPYNCFCSKPKGRRKCRIGICSRLYDEIVLEHSSADPLWTNTDPSTWCSDPGGWSYGKSFQTTTCPGLSAKETDAAGLLSILINNFTIHNDWLACNHTSNLTCPFGRAKDMRNEIMHSSKLELDKPTLDLYLDTFITVLQDAKCLLYCNRSQEAVKKLSQLKLHQINISLKDERRLVQKQKEALSELDGRKTEGLREIGERTATAQSELDERKTEGLSEISNRTAIAHSELDERKTEKLREIVERTATAHSELDERITEGLRDIGKRTATAHSELDERKREGLLEIGDKTATAQSELDERKTEGLRDICERNATAKSELDKRKTEVLRDIGEMSATAHFELDGSKAEGLREIDKRTATAQSELDERKIKGLRVIGNRTGTAHSELDERKAEGLREIVERIATAHSELDERKKEALRDLCEKTATAHSALDERKAEGLREIGNRTATAHSELDAKKTEGLHQIGEKSATTYSELEVWKIKGLREIGERSATANSELEERKTEGLREIGERTATVHSELYERKTEGIRQIGERTATAHSALDERKTQGLREIAERTATAHSELDERKTEGLHEIIERTTTAHTELEKRKKEGLREIDIRHASAVTSFEKHVENITEATAKRNVKDEKQKALYNAQKVKENTKATLSELEEAKKGAINDIKEITKKALSELEKAKKGAVQGVEENTKAALSEIQVAKKGAVQDVKENTKDALSYIGKTMKGALQSVHENTKPVLSELEEAGKGAAHDDQENTKALLSEFEETKEGVAQDVKDNTNGALPQFEEAIKGAEYDVNEKFKAAFSELEKIKKSTVQHVQGITKAAMFELQEARKGAAHDVKENKTAALSELEGAKKGAIQEVKENTKAALSELEKAKKMAITDIEKTAMPGVQNTKKMAKRDLTKRIKTAYSGVKQTRKRATDDKERIEIASSGVKKPTIRDMMNIEKRTKTAIPDVEKARERIAKELKEDLIALYRKQYHTLPLSPLIEERDTQLLQFYVMPDINSMEIRSSFGGGKEIKSSVKSLHDVFYKKNKLCHEIYLTADAGLGKTAFSKRLVLTWCQSIRRIESDQNTFKEEDIQPMSEFEFVFLVSLRDCTGNCDIDEMIIQQIIPRLAHNVTRSNIENILSNGKCLVILDGLDEWTHPNNACKLGSSDIPHRKARECTILTTTKPWKLSVISLRSSQIEQKLELVGLNKISAGVLKKNVISLLSGQTEVENLIQDFNSTLQHKGISDLERTPILLMYLLCLWCDGIDLGRSKCELYCQIVEMLLKRMFKKNYYIQLAPGTTQDSIPQCFSEHQHLTINYPLVKALGQLAFETLFSEKLESTLVFSQSVAQMYLNKDDMKLCFDSGILTQNKEENKLTSQCSKISFSDKTVHEFFGAVYISCQNERGVQKLVKQKFHSVQNILDMSQVFVFISGLNSEIMSSISRELMPVISSDQITRTYRSMTGYDYRYINHLKDIQNMFMSCLKENPDNASLCFQDLIIDLDYEKEKHFVDLRWHTTHNNNNIQSVYIATGVQSLREIIDIFNLDKLRSLRKICFRGECEEAEIIRLLTNKSLECVTVISATWQGNYFIPKLMSCSSELSETFQNISQLRAISIDCFMMEHNVLEMFINNITSRKPMAEIVLYNIHCVKHGQSCREIKLDFSRHAGLRTLGLSRIPLTQLKVNVSSLEECDVGRLSKPGLVTSLLRELPAASKLHTFRCVSLESSGDIETMLETLPLLVQVKDVKLVNINLDGRSLTLTHDMVNIESIDLLKVTMSTSSLHNLVKVVEKLPQSVTVDMRGCNITPETEFNYVKKYLKTSENFVVTFDNIDQFNEYEFVFQTTEVGSRVH